MSERQEMLDKLSQMVADLKKVKEMDRVAVAEQVKAEMEAAQPVRKGEDSELVGPPGSQASNPIVQEGKFAGLKRSDLEFTAAVLRAGQRAPGVEARPPSEELVKALTSTGSGSGDELVPTAMAAEIWGDFFTASRVAASLGPPIPMPTDPYDIPLELGDVTWYKGAQNTATTATDVATSKSTLTSTEQICEVDFSYSLDEDSIVAILPTLRARLSISGAEQIDNFILNADDTDAATGNINLDDADPAATAWYLSDGQDGIRHQWLIDAATASGLAVNAGGDALTDSDVLDAMKMLDKYAIDYRNCRIYTDFSTYIAGLMNLDTVLTLDKYGPQAVVLSGELGSYRGIPIIVSASHKLCEADGKISTTAGNNTLGSISLAHAPSWYYGFRRSLLFEVDRDIQKRQLILVVSFRIAVGAFGTRASATHTAGVRNILVS